MHPERLHPSGIAVFASGALRDAAIPLVIVLVFAVLGQGADEFVLLRLLVFLVGGALVAAIIGYARWLTTTWWISDDGSVYRRSSFVITRTTSVPLSRVQSLDIERGPAQRLFGVHALHVQTGGGGAGGEIVLDAITDDVVERLRTLVAEHGAGHAAEEVGDPRPEGAGSVGGGGAHPPRTAVTRESPATPPVERRIGGSDLLLAAITAGQFGVLIPVVAPVLNQLSEGLFRFERGQVVIGSLPDSAAGWGIGVVALILGAWLLSVAGTIVVFGGFAVSRDGDRLRIRRGLVVHREATVPIERVRAVHIVEGVLRRPVRRASLRLEVIGYAAEPAASRTLFPLLRRDDVSRFLEAVLPELDDDLDGLGQPPRRAMRRYVLLPALVGLAAGVVAWALGSVGAWGLLLAVPAAAYGAARYRAAGWRLAGGQLAVRSLLLARTTVFAPIANRESHTLAQTLLQRRGRLADLEVDFGKSTTATIRHLDAAVAASAFAAIDAGDLAGLRSRPAAGTRRPPPAARCSGTASDAV